jgi:hypothetical protein
MILKSQCHSIPFLLPCSEQPVEFSVVSKLSLITLLLRQAEEVTHDILETRYRRLVTVLHLHHEVVRELIGCRPAPGSLRLLLLTFHHLHRYEG